MLEGVVGELRRVMRRRMTVAGRPIEGDCAVSCGHGGEKHSVSGETGTVGLPLTEPGVGALGRAFGSLVRLCHSTSF